MLEQVLQSPVDPPPDPPTSEAKKRVSPGPDQSLAFVTLYGSTCVKHLSMTYQVTTRSDGKHMRIQSFICDCDGISSYIWHGFLSFLFHTITQRLDRPLLVLLIYLDQPTRTNQTTLSNPDGHPSQDAVHTTPHIPDHDRA